MAPQHYFGYTRAQAAQALAQLHQTLVGAPSAHGLQLAVMQAIAYLQVPQTALVLFTPQGAVEVVVAVRGNLPPLTTATVAHWRAVTEVVAARTVQAAPPWAEWVAPLRVQAETLGVWWLAARAPGGGYAHFRRDFLRQAGPSLALAAQAWLLFEASQAVARNLLQAREAERFRVALELHDEPLQQLAVVGQRLGTLAQTLTPPLANEALGCQSMVRDLSERLRAICQGLHPPVLERGVGYAVTEAVNKFRQATGLRVQLTLAVPDYWLTPEAITTAAYHITTEALNNVRKHANAHMVHVQAVLQGQRLTLTIADDGQGIALAGGFASHFAQGKALAVGENLVEAVKRQHLGLVGMHEWARLAGGTLRVQPHAGGGTEVVLEVIVPE